MQMDGKNDDLFQNLFHEWEEFSTVQQEANQEVEDVEEAQAIELAAPDEKKREHAVCQSVTHSHNGRAFKPTSGNAWTQQYTWQEYQFQLHRTSETS